MWFKVHKGIIRYTYHASPEEIGKAFKAALDYFVAGYEWTPTTDESAALYNALRNEIDKAKTITDAKTTSRTPQYLSYQAVDLLYALLGKAAAERIIKAVTEQVESGHPEQLRGTERVVFDVLTGGGVKNG